MHKLATLFAASLGLTFVSTSASADMLSKMLSGQPAMSKKKLKKAIAKAEAFPLGSRENPVRAQMPPGQHAYLQRLRCSNGEAPRYQRTGNLGIGVYQTIIDAYEVTCGEADPGTVTIIMDMYHAGHIETRPVPGFTIVAP